MDTSTDRNSNPLSLSATSAAMAARTQVARRNSNSTAAHLSRSLDSSLDNSSGNGNSLLTEFEAFLAGEIDSPSSTAFDVWSAKEPRGVRQDYISLALQVVERAKEAGRERERETRKQKVFGRSKPGEEPDPTPATPATPATTSATTAASPAAVAVALKPRRRRGSLKPGLPSAARAATAGPALAAMRRGATAAIGGGRRDATTAAAVAAARGALTGGAESMSKAAVERRVNEWLTFLGLGKSVRVVWLNEGAGKGGSLREVGSIKDPTKRKLTLSVSLKLFDGKEGGALLEAFCAHELGTHGVRAMADWRQPWAKNAKREVRFQGRG